MKLIKLFILLIIISCSPSGKKQENYNSEAESKEIVNSNVQKTEFKEPIYFTYEEIAKYTIVSIMFQEYRNLKVKNKNNLFTVSYIKDGKLNTFKIKFDKNKIMWGNSDGRWRNESKDEKLFFEEKDDKLIISQVWSDGSVSKDEYIK